MPSAHLWVLLGKHVLWHMAKYILVEKLNKTNMRGCQCQKPYFFRHMYSYPFETNTQSTDSSDVHELKRAKISPKIT